jgi:tetratricopeptide (TPR) repeat protein
MSRRGGSPVIGQGGASLTAPILEWRVPSIGEALQVAIAHHQAGNLAEAERLYRQILALDPRHADSLHLLGVIAFHVGRADAGRSLIGEAIGINPQVPEYYNNLGNILKETGADQEALACYRRALELRPGFVDAHFNLGNTHAKEERFDAAIESYRAALQLQAGHAGSWLNLGNTLRSLGRIEEALECYRHVPTSSPFFAEARWNRAIALLLGGELTAGWEDYEGRWDLERAKPRRRDFPQPAWDGSTAKGRRILLHAEQGLGDTIQFIRYAALVKARGLKVLLECPAALQSLLARASGIAQVVASGEALPEFDLHLPLLSLPRVFGTTLESIPAPRAYLSPDPSLARKWKAKLGGTEPGPRVGLVWAGGTSDRKRDCGLAALAPLAAARRATFYSLQVGEAAGQAARPPPGMHLVDLSPELKNFSDTAALIGQLDLVITTDTAAAHLAAALGKPTWILLRYAPDWRWLLGRDDSPWYPSARLFRQHKAGDWAEPIECAASALRSFRKSRT